MMPFSRASQQVIEGFTAQLGLPLRPARDGSYSFAFASSGTLSLTASQDGGRVFVSLARRPARVDENTMRRALAMAGFKATMNDLVRVGLSSDDNLHFALTIDASAFDLPSLDIALQGLNDMHDRIA